MSELKSPQLRFARSGSDQPGRVPLRTRLLLHDSLTARRAAGVAGVTLLVTVAGGILERLLDHQEFPTIGKGLWFSLQTVTTVGYGDVMPERAAGRIITAVVMLTAIGFLAVITASATAALVRAAGGASLPAPRQTQRSSSRSRCPTGAHRSRLGPGPPRR